MVDARAHYNNDGMDPDWKPAETTTHHYTGCPALTGGECGCAPPPWVPEGWKLVPIKPTLGMLMAGKLDATVAELYGAMLNAAPPCPMEGGER